MSEKKIDQRRKRDKPKEVIKQMEEEQAKITTQIDYILAKELIKND